MSIPWPDETKANAANANRSQLVAFCREFDECPMMQMAYDTIVGELLFSKLRWVTAAGVALPKLEVPPGWEQLVCDCVRGVLVGGVFFWRKRGKIPEVAHPSQVWYTRAKGWTPVVMYPPHPHTYDNGSINSPVRRATPPSRALHEHRCLQLNRDRINSKPSVFVSIDSRLQNNNGKSKPWFRAVGREFVDSIGEQLESSNQPYDFLVSDRAEVITNLGDATVQQRKRKRPHEDVADVDSEQKFHREHIISDGFEGTAVAPLVSLSDGQKTIADLEHAVLLAMGVPPAALGRNVNSERLASANQLVMYSLRSFKTTISRMKRLIDGFLRAASAMPDGTYISFTTVLSQFDIDQLEGVLTTEATIKAYSQAYDIPSEWMDAAAVDMKRAALHGGAESKTKVDDTARKDAAKSRKPPSGATDAP